MKYIDIFAGCGGMSLGLHKAGLKGLFAVEKSDMAFETLKFNLIEKNKHFDWVPWLDVKAYDINFILKNHKDGLSGLKNKVDLVAGGPPCQGFSLAGRRKEDDNRNKLIDSYIEFIRLVKPKYLLFENVRGFNVGFKKSNGKRGMAYSQHVLNQLDAIGYNVKSQIVNFSDFGVPQRRQRFIIFGVRKDISSENDFFERLYSERKAFLKNKRLPTDKPVTIKQAISDLLEDNGTFISEDFPRFKMGKYKKGRSTIYQNIMKKELKSKNPDSHRFANHNPKTIDKFNYILECEEKNKTISEEMKKKFNLKKHCVIPLCDKSTSPTLTTLPDDYVHYSEPRILTVREYARIQSFPDNFEFKSKYTSGGENRKKEVPRYTQIGNAIPPFFGEVAGIVIEKWELKNQTKKEISVKEKIIEEVRI